MGVASGVSLPNDLQLYADGSTALSLLRIHCEALGSTYPAV